VKKTLHAMAEGGIFDHLGGGFHRYSTDNQWPKNNVTIMPGGNEARKWTPNALINEKSPYLLQVTHFFRR